MTRTDGKRYCTYCRLPKPPEGFTKVFDKTGRLRNYKCADCTGMRRKSPAERDAVAQKRRDERKAAEVRRMQEITKKREGNRAQKLELSGKYLSKRYGENKA